MASAPKLKVGFVFDDTLDSNDGVAQYVKILGGWLSGQGHHVRYLVGQTDITSWKAGRVYSLAQNQKVTFNGNRLSVPLPANKKNIRRILEEERFDILHVMVPYSPFLAQRVIMATAPQTAIVGTFHIFPAGWLSSVGSRLLKQSYRRSLPRFSKIVSVSRPAADFASRAFGINSDVIPNAVELKKFKNSPKSADNSVRRIIFLGRLVKRKGCRQLIEAFCLIHDDYPDLRLQIAGDGPQRPELQGLVDKKGLTSKIDFLGYIKEEDKPALLAGASIACFPSLYGEAFGIVLIEAMAAGSGPILAGDNPGYRSVLAEQPEILIDANDTMNFAVMICRLLDDDKLRQDITAWQAKTVAQYDIGEVGRQVLRLYRTVIAQKSKKSHNYLHE